MTKLEERIKAFQDNPNKLAQQTALPGWFVPHPTLENAPGEEKETARPNEDEQVESGEEERPTPP